MSWEPLTFPAWARWEQRKGIQLDHPGDDRSRCRWCGEPLTGRRTSWCSNRCNSSFGRVWSWGAVRTYVIGRDKVCQRCSTDQPGRWEVDHIIRVVDGGTDNPANLRLLCEACHVVVGYEQRASSRPSLVSAAAALDSNRACR